MSVCVAQSSLSAFSHMYLSLSSVFQSDCRSLKYCVCCVQNVSRWVCLRSSSRRHPSHYVNYVLNEQYQYESVPNHKWMYGKIFNFHFAMRVALGVRMMSSLWNSIDSLDRDLCQLGAQYFYIYASHPLLPTQNIITWRFIFQRFYTKWREPKRQRP